MADKIVYRCLPSSNERCTCTPEDIALGRDCGAIREPKKKRRGDGTHRGPG